ncbi:LPXTG cell wall anchor domain-containing protein [Enterococcus faecalis]|uniref:LPXTG cell wall anchor domain-containing protein n=1 Tax=Enterococcus faecalis TaxID=1351 RepID=UPI0011417460|nr:LPXTG cell wall anchor domain-containing protein [Enterococcus faecalis]MBP4077155.1 LPXTG cell wall anchor domain-containing protein [Enterococcus faecalis]MBP4095291.1 LPXTG cell wall anchor domain-containing protein [Enterococcus faecalis]NSV60255.1 LPXTG cell wall anchor domain-containing protein [Enterococcus faecalis]TQA87522.1 LPXTG cell wall anchor domain-containing protein [Enterococcus faecalis]
MKMSIPNGEVKKRYKQHKVGKHWVTIPVVFIGLFSTALLTSQDSFAAEPDQPVTAETQNDVSSQPTTAEKETSVEPTQSVNSSVADVTTNSTEKVAPTAEEATPEVQPETPATPEVAPEAPVESNIPTNVGPDITQDKAKETIDGAQETLKGDFDSAEKNGVDVTDKGTSEVILNENNKQDKTNEVLNDLNAQDQKVKEAEQKQKENQKAYEDSLKDHKEAVKEGDKKLTDSTKDLDKEVKDSKDAGLTVDVSQKTITPNYKDTKGLTGKALLQAMDSNIVLYKAAIDQAVKNQTADTKKLAAMREEYLNMLKIYKTATEDYNKALTAGQKNLAESTKRVDDLIKDAEKVGIKPTVNQSTVTPKYVSTKGLSGKKLQEAMATNIALYNKAVASGVAKQDKATSEMRAKIEKYLKDLADYKKGISANTGLKWGNATVQAGKGAQKMTGREIVISEGDGTLKTAAMYATQGSNLNQNKDANFNNIFKINGTGTIIIRGTTNGDVTFTFTDIAVPQGTTGTYVAFWGDKNGGIAWSVFGTYYGDATGGSGENAGGGVTGSGNILTLVSSYRAKVTTSGKVSVVTFNDIDNDQTVKMSGLNGKVTTGKNVTRNGNDFTAGPGDVSQGSSGVLSSNGVRWVYDEAGQLTFTFVHNTTTRATSIVGGLFGAESELPKEPTKPKLTLEKVNVDVPEAPEEPEAPKAEVTKYTVAVLPAPEKPQDQKIDVHYFTLKTTPKEEVVTSVATPTQEKLPENLTIEKASVAPELPHTGEKENTLLSVLGAGILAGLSWFGLRKREVK